MSTQQNLFSSQPFMHEITSYADFFNCYAIKIIIHDLTSNTKYILCDTHDDINQTVPTPRENQYVIYYDPFYANTHISPSGKCLDNINANRYFCHSEDEIKTILKFLAENAELLIV